MAELLKTDITYRVRTPNAERLFSDFEAACKYWVSVHHATIEAGSYQTVDGKTVWVKQA